MAITIDALLNDFASRCFRDIADADYITSCLLPPMSRMLQQPAPHGSRDPRFRRKDTSRKASDRTLATMIEVVTDGKLPRSEGAA